MKPKTHPDTEEPNADRQVGAAIGSTMLALMNDAIQSEKSGADIEVELLKIIEAGQKAASEASGNKGRN